MVTQVKGSVAEDYPIYVGSVAELEALSLPVGTAVYLTEDGRAGQFVVKTGTPPSDPQKGIYIVLANGNYAERSVTDYGNIRAEWFGVKVDNSTDDYAAWQAAINWAAQAVDGGQGATVKAKTGVTLISNTIDLPNRVALSGPNGRGLVFRPHSTFAASYMFHAANGTSSMFGSRLDNMYIDARGKNMTAVVLSDAWQETCGMENVVIQFDGTTGIGLLYQSGFGGAAYLPLKDIEIFADSTAAVPTAIKVNQISQVGGFVLSVDGLTAAGTPTNLIAHAILMTNDSLVTRGVLHVEYANNAISMSGAGSLSADTVTGSVNAVTDLITLGSGFTGKVSARNIIPNGATGQSIKNNISGVNVPAALGMLPEYAYPAVRSENTALAWVVFNGADGAIQDAFNVDSVTRSAAGNYVLNYSDALPSGFRSVTGSTNVDSADAVVIAATGSTSTTDQIKTRRLGAFAGAYVDPQRVAITVFGPSVI